MEITKNKIIYAWIVSSTLFSKCKVYHKKTKFTMIWNLVSKYYLSFVYKIYYVVIITILINFDIYISFK